VRRTAGLLLALVVATLGAGIGVAMVGRTPGMQTAGVGALAELLAQRHAEHLVDALIAPADRVELSAVRIQNAWDSAVAAAGAFQRVVRTVTVRGGSGRSRVGSVVVQPRLSDVVRDPQVSRYHRHAAASWYVHGHASRRCRHEARARPCDCSVRQGAACL